MDFLNHYILSIIIWLPAAGALLTLVAKSRESARWTALATTIVTFAASLLLFLPGMFDWHKVGGAYAYADQGGVVQLVQRADWIKAFNVQYLVGVDGLSFPLLILSTFICVLSCIASWKIDKMTKGYFALFLFLETG